MTLMKLSYVFDLHACSSIIRYILTAARLITPQLDKRDWAAGYQWAVDALKPDHESLASELEIEMALMYLKKREFEKVRGLCKSPCQTIIYE